MAALASEYLADVLEPEKFAAAIFGVTLTFTVLSANVVGFRTWFRVRRKQFGSDDYLMCTALLVNLVHNAIVMHGTFVGIGSPDSKLNPELETEGRKVRRRWSLLQFWRGAQLTLAAVPLPLANLLRHQPRLYKDQHPRHPETCRQGETIHLYRLGSHRHREPAKCCRGHHPVGQVPAHHVELDGRGYLHGLGCVCRPVEDCVRL